MYQPIPLPSHLGPLVRWVVQETIDLRLSDVHAMLRLPLPEQGIEAGGNFAIADVLFAVIEGVSAVLYPRHMAEGDGFTNCVERHYHAHLEPAGALTGTQLASALWSHFRNPMQHCLGLALARPDKQGIRDPLPRAYRLVVFRDTKTLPEGDIESMETAEAWPQRLHRPTLAIHGEQMRLSVEAFYLGVRRMVASVLADQNAMGHAEESLSRQQNVVQQPQGTNQPVPRAALDFGTTSSSGTYSDFTVVRPRTIE